MKNIFATILLVIMCLSSTSCKEKVTTTKTITENKTTNYSLRLERGAFHYDSFELTLDELTFLPSEIDSSGQNKYKTAKSITLDTAVTNVFFKELEAKGIWDVKERYILETSCTSASRIIFKANEKEIRINCDDYHRGSPELIYYIEEKIIALEGNNLKRIYLPG